MQNAKAKTPALFDNLLTLDGLLADFSARGLPRSKWTVYRWVTKGCPVQKIAGRVYFKLDEVALWLERTNRERIQTAG